MAALCIKDGFVFLMSELKFLVCIATIFLLAGCSLYYHQSTLKPVESSATSKLVQKYGNGQFYRLSSGMDKVRKSKDDEIIGAKEQIEIQLKGSNICPSGFELLPETYSSYEYGAVAITIKCSVVE
jgi:hypothetical protein